ncbi:MAG TPA: indolepyruvate ferredoxin oxidoreductase family protein [Burkholderiales bacterium]
MNAPLPQVSLEDKYLLTSGRVYVSGMQALVRLLIMQRLRDQAAGLNTAGFVSGYRGSPLGGLDKALWEATPHLAAHHIRFQPGVNEDLAATAVWGTQQVHLVGSSPYDGIFAMWYGKGPGVDRCGDVFKHANHFGTARHGGVLLVAGDDHAAYSSTLPHQSDHQFAAAVIPVLYPCNVQEYLDLGLHGWAMSRYSGCLVGFKATSDTAESSASVDGDPFRVEIRLPDDFVMPPGGLNNRIHPGSIRQQALAQEALMHDYKIYAALAYARANKLNRTVIDAPQARLGIVASGKSYLDVREALEELGIDERAAARIGVRVFKVAMPWPLEPESVREFARGLEEILVVEEKRQIVEYQLKEQLYNWREDVRPRVIGKFDEKGEWVAPHGEWLLPAKGDLTVAQIARVIAARIGRFHQSDLIKARLAFLAAKEAVLSRANSTPPRPAYYCSGCPHNTSTRVPEGSLALAGIGCHTMATAIYADGNRTITHMGGEGATWIGQAPFSNREHMFVNLGDGTYYHSGYLAIRAAVAARANVTYKLLYNDAVAMTGGQPIDGPLTVPRIAQQVAAEGVERIAIVTEDPGRYRSRAELPAFATVHDRAELDAVQRELRTYRGVSVLIYDQTCAAEKRRRRKQGKYPQATQRVFINAAVCEGCGDCGVQSNCVSILPLETELGRKRAIDQYACNQDYSCLKGFCPSFVTLEGARVRRPRAAGPEAEALFAPLPEPAKPALARPYNILVTGIGGTGVITIGALLGMAAHLEGKGVSVLDMTGLAQKNGAVTSHIRLAANPGAIHAQAIATGEADVILGCDMLTAGAQEAISKTRPGRTVAVINTHEQPTGPFAQNPDWRFPAEEVRTLIAEAVAERVFFVNATRLATALVGDAIATNLFMLGYAYQKGLVPLSAGAIERAIELNAVAVESNKRAFGWGRRAAYDQAKVEGIVDTRRQIAPLPETLDALIDRRAAFLAKYQNRAYAAAYERFVREVQAAERRVAPGERLTRAVAENLFKLMTYKDEYEVARLYTDGEFERELNATFEGAYTIRFHLAPPVLARRDANGRPQKRQFGPWLRHALRLVAALRFLRGTPFDPFGRTAERRTERRLIQEYRADIAAVCAVLAPERLDDAVALARLPEEIRGFGHVKQAHLEKVRARWAALRETLLQTPSGEVPPIAAPRAAGV